VHLVSAYTGRNVSKPSCHFCDRIDQGLSLLFDVQKVGDLKYIYFPALIAFNIVLIMNSVAEIIKERRIASCFPLDAA
jgi:hypothetical protein